MLTIETIVSGRWKENCYVISNDGDAVVIDPGGAFPQVQEHVAAAQLHVHAVINTHAHFDHLGAATAVVKEYSAPFHLHPADSDLLRRANFYGTLFMGEEPINIPEVEVELSDGMPLRFGSLELEVVHTPGHTPGGVCFETAAGLFTGDTVMAEHLGRTDLPGGDRAVLAASLQLLSERYPPETPLHPGHGAPALLGEVLSRLGALPELR
jgi:hydroxyacylglutathione hydrolase